eukprot:scaffold14485_cov99-Isochrysis_galbana.AAC.2
MSAGWSHAIMRSCASECMRQRLMRIQEGPQAAMLMATILVVPTDAILVASTAAILVMPTAAILVVPTAAILVLPAAAYSCSPRERPSNGWRKDRLASS